MTCFRKSAAQDSAIAASIAKRAKQQRNGRSAKTIAFLPASSYPWRRSLQADLAITRMHDMRQEALSIKAAFSVRLNRRWYHANSDSSGRAWSMGYRLG